MVSLATFAMLEEFFVRFKPQEGGTLAYAMNCHTLRFGMGSRVKAASPDLLRSAPLIPAGVGSSSTTSSTTSATTASTSTLAS